MCDFAKTNDNRNSSSFHPQSIGKLKFIMRTTTGVARRRQLRLITGAYRCVSLSFRLVVFCVSGGFVQLCCCV